MEQDAISRPGRKRWRRALQITALVLILALLAGYLWYRSAVYAPSAAAREALQDGNGVEVTREGDWIRFRPTAQTKSPAVLFYPGALVDERSYAPIGRRLAKQGYPVYVLSMPFKLAVLGADRADNVLDSAPDGAFVIGGHSLGGVMAARYAAEHPDRLKGVFFLASYPDEKGSLKDKGLPVLQIIASRDGVLNRKAWEEAKAYEPADTAYVQIEGGNHAGFGSYGAQRGDKTALISQEKQHDQVADALARWLGGMTHIPK